LWSRGAKPPAFGLIAKVQYFALANFRLKVCLIKKNASVCFASYNPNNQNRNGSFYFTRNIRDNLQLIQVKIRIANEHAATVLAHFPKVALKDR
jgi:hypothetical protein